MLESRPIAGLPQHQLRSVLSSIEKVAFVSLSHNSNTVTRALLGDAENHGGSGNSCLTTSTSTAVFETGCKLSVLSAVVVFLFLLSDENGVK